MSGDPEQEFFADGLTEDIITELSRFRDLMVISRNAVFVHKGKPVTARGIAQEFGVDYVVEGSVRKAGDRVRVTVQLIDGETETHVWAERYDRKLEDIFAIQDEVTAAIVSTLRGRVEAAQSDRAKRKRPRTWRPTNMCSRARSCTTVRMRDSTRRRAARSNARSRSIPNTRTRTPGRPACSARLRHGWFDDPERASESGSRRSWRPRSSLDENDADVHRILAAVHLTFNRFDKAAYHQERALSLSPNYDLVVVQQGEMLTWLGRPEEGIEWIRRGDAAQPLPSGALLESSRPGAIYRARLCRRDRVLRPLTAPDHTHHAFLAAAAAQMGNAHRGRRACPRGARPEPGIHGSDIPRHAALQPRRRHGTLREGLLKAGLPD